MEGGFSLSTTIVDTLNITTTVTTTELPKDFVDMYCDQEIQCHSEAGEIVPNTLDELVDYLDIEGEGKVSGLFADEIHTITNEQFKEFTTFGTEDEWPV